MKALDTEPKRRFAIVEYTLREVSTDKPLELHPVRLTPA
jgi:hypothetical protein